MRVVALISGGKDSCYNMVQCVAAGHEIVALANLRPENKGMFFSTISLHISYRNYFCKTINGVYF
jgi:diphthamide synthase (EF-2-diphthine--ammonia ligase)